MLLVSLCFILGVLTATCTGRAKNNCANDKCEMLGATEICTQCNAGFVPIGGVCTAHNDQAVVAGTGAGCQKAGDTAVDERSTVCEKCTKANYFLFMGGCYKTGEAPGNLICTAAASGKCSACVENGNVFKNKNSSPTLGTECILCSDDTGSNNNKGVANCATCTAPSADSGTATCKTCLPEFALDGSANACISNSGTGGNVNESGLSTGAIAGIAVAVVIVVGGLVGFLCWWFLCRGKA